MLGAGMSKVTDRGERGRAATVEEVVARRMPGRGAIVAVGGHPNPRKAGVKPSGRAAGGGGGWHGRKERDAVVEVWPEAALGG